MTKIYTILFSFALFLCTILPAFASDTYSTGNDTTTPTVVTETVVPDVVVNNEIIVEDSEDLGTYVGTSVYALSPVGSGDTTGLKSVVLALIGDYDAVVVEHAYENTNGYTSYVREIQPDYAWLCSCAIFLVVLFCILRGGFSVLCKR